ncbi:hypothetical protein DIPPA_22225 [Diplonema papillatum]|nr:hypothetical protein DIPPA_22225 [Diplonema papillatum]
MSKGVTDRAVIDGQEETVVYGTGEIEELTADDGVYEGEVLTVVQDGEKVRSIPHGGGTFRWNNGDVYEGEWAYNEQNGKGKFTYRDGGYYQGDWVRDEQHGYGFLSDCNGEYEGEFEGDERSGTGKQVYKNNDIYTGSWLADKRHGYGSQKWADGATYEGTWADDTMNGRGSYIFENGDTYEGEFDHDQKTGWGHYTWADNRDQLVKYMGGFLNGKRHGEGIERYRNGDWQIGVWKDGHPCGQQTLHKRDPFKYGDQQFSLSSVKRVTEEFQPHVSDEVMALLEEANKKGEVLKMTLPRDVEEELKKAQSEIKKAEEVVKMVPGGAAARQREAIEQARKKEEEKARQALSPTHLTSPVTSPTSNNPFAPTPNPSFSAQNIDAFLREHSNDLEDASFQSWRLGNLLGQGSYGAVYAGLKRDGTMMAVKCIELGNIEEEEDVNALVNEIGVMKRLQHTNIVRYLGAKKDPTADILYIFLEYVPGGSLAAVIKKFGTLDNETARRYTKQVCFALGFLHGKGIIHRDIKGDNILLTGDGIVKLADFGCSKNLLELQAKTHGVAAKSMVGTPYWMAPEVITNQEKGYTFTADIWSIGCTVVEMLTSKPPWPEFSSMWGAVFHIANSTGPPEGIPSDLPEDTKEFLHNCFQRDVDQRFTADQLLKTAWMTA